jgi:hypothetical protein
VLARLDSTRRRVGDFVALDGYVYFFIRNRSLGVESAFYDLVRVSIGSGSLEDVAHFEGDVGPDEVAFDSTSTLYWPAGAGQNASVMSYDLITRAMTELASERSLKGGIAVDDTYVYWTEWEALMRKRR